MTESSPTSSSSPTSALSVRGLRVWLPGVVLLDGVDLEVRPGRLHVLLGGSGSGKTTLLRALIGLVAAPGRVEADRLLLQLPDGDHDLSAAGAAQWRRVRGRHIGLVGQDPSLSLSPLRRVDSMAREVDRLTRTDQARGASDRLLREAGFADPRLVGRRYCFELSGGMAQRLGLGLAIAPRPQVLLADEPSTALDALARAALVDRLRTVVRDGACVVLSTHDVALATELADDVTVLEQGRVVESGAARDVLVGSASVITRRLLDAPRLDDVRPLGDRAGQARPGAGPALAVRGLRASYRGTGPVLDGVDLQVGAGEIVGVAGRSGAGKSTLLRCIVGLEQPDDGMVVVNGSTAATTGWKQLRRQVQLVPQDPRASLNPWRTVEQLVADSLDAHRLGTRPERRARVLELLERTGLSGYPGRRPGELSTGQCQRVAIARALALRPTLLVADEPVTALDAPLRVGVLRLLRDLVRENQMAALVISHDLFVLEQLCDRVAVLDRGRIVENLAVGDLRERAAHPLTLAFLAAHPLPLETGSR